MEVLYIVLTVTQLSSIIKVVIKWKQQETKNIRTQLVTLAPKDKPSMIQDVSGYKLSLWLIVKLNEDVIQTCNTD